MQHKAQMFKNTAMLVWEGKLFCFLGDMNLRDMTYREQSCTCSQSSSPSLQGRLCLPPRPMWSKNQESNLRHQLKGPPFISSVPCYQPTEMTLPVRGLGRGTTFVTTNFPVTWTHGGFCSALSALLKLLVASSKILGKVLI